MSAKIFGTFFNPNSKSNSFSEHFNTKSHNLVVNFFNPYHRHTHLPIKPNKPTTPTKQNIFSHKHTSQGHGSILTVQTD